MSLLADKVKFSLDHEAEEKKRQAKLEEQRKARVARELAQLRRDTFRFLNAELHGQFGFTIRRQVNDGHGKLATIRRNGEFKGWVYVRHESYKFRGGGRHHQIALSTGAGYLTTNRLISSNTLDIFKESLATWVTDQVRRDR